MGFTLFTSMNYIKLDKPICVGCILVDFSKLHILNFQYTIIETQLEHNYSLSYSHTTIC